VDAGERRLCERCGVSYPLTQEYFRFRDGAFRTVCRPCVRAEKKDERRRAKARRKTALAKVEADGVSLWLSQVKAGGSNVPHSAEVIERVIEYFGGTSGFSAMLVKQYYDSPPGGTARTRLLETICRLVSKNVDQGGARRPLSLWSEDELEVELQTRFKQAVKIVQGEVEGGKKAKTTSAALTAKDPVDSAPEPVREAGTQEPAERTTGTEDRGSEALPAEPEPGGDSQVPSE
jgi:hypothetical protein